MDPLTLSLGVAGSNVLGGLLGNIFSSGSQQQALALQKQALQGIMNVNQPSIDQLRVALQQEQLAGQLNPEMEGLVTQGPSAMNNISVDPRLQNAQMQALQSLQQYGKGGLRPQDIAALAQIRQQSAQAEHANEAAILQNMQERGIGGSGDELAAKLSSAQNQANSMAMQGLQTGAQANQAALQAILNSGQLGSQMQQQNFGEQAQIAQAQDVINRYNAMNQQQVMGQNIAAQNAAQAQNLYNQQQVMNANTQIANQQEMYNQYLPEMVYQNQMGQAQSAANVTNQAANAEYQNAANTQNMWSGIGSGISKGISAGAIYGQQQQQIDNQQKYLEALQGLYGKSPSSGMAALPGGQPATLNSGP